MKSYVTVGVEEVDNIIIMEPGVILADSEAALTEGYLWIKKPSGLIRIKLKEILEQLGD